MNRGDVIRYVDMTIEEGFSIQRGMNFNVANKDCGIILMRVRENAPYADRFEDNGTIIIYEWHDVKQNYAPAGSDPKKIDQPMTIPSGLPSENGKFFAAAQGCKSGKPAKLIKVYEKIKDGIWVYNGFLN